MQEGGWLDGCGISNEALPVYNGPSVVFHIFGLRALQILIETFSLILNAIKKISNVSGVCRVPRVENNQSASELLIIKSSKIYYTECRLQFCGK